MSQTKRAIFASIAVALCAVASVGVAQAGDVIGGIDMQTFTADVVVATNAHVTVTETITGVFSTPHHGIYRSIPYRYEVDGEAYGVPITVTNVLRDGAAVLYDEFKENGNIVLKIGSESVLVSGPFTYKISYELDRVVLSHDDGAFFSWDAPGDGWEDAFESVAVNVETEYASNVLDTACYSDEFSVTADACTIATYTGRETTVSFTAAVPITATVLFDPLRFVVPEESLLTTFAYNHSDYFFFLLPFATFVLMFAAWWRNGRDPAGRGVIVPEYEPPAGLGPAEVGALHDGRVQKHDIIAMIVDLAVRGYLVIEEREKDYALVKTAKGEEGLRDYEVTFMRTTFGSDQEVVLKGRVEKFGRAWKAAARDVYGRMAADGLFVKNPETVRGVFLFIGVAIIMVTWFVAPNFGTSVPFVAGLATAAIIIIFGLQMPRRTHKGVMMWEHVQGYKLFLSTAEKHRLAWQQREKIFEKYLPYALALGVADVWTKDLAPTLKEPPTWYRGNWATWNAWYFMHHMGGFSSAMNRSYASATASSRSGGGGFSGGGFGGGGGGGW